MYTVDTLSSYPQPKPTDINEKISIPIVNNNASGLKVSSGSGNGQPIFRENTYLVDQSKFRIATLLLMSWDIVLFNSTQTIEHGEDIDENQLQPTDFHGAFVSHFPNRNVSSDYVEVVGNDFTMDYYISGEPASNMIVNLYGENALYELVRLAKQQGWQLFDTSLGQMIDLDNPSVNGYDNFQAYLQHILNR